MSSNKYTLLLLLFLLHEPFSILIGQKALIHYISFLSVLSQLESKWLPNEWADLFFGKRETSLCLSRFNHRAQNHQVVTPSSLTSASLSCTGAVCRLRQRVGVEVRVLLSYFLCLSLRSHVENLLPSPLSPFPSLPFDPLIYDSGLFELVCVLRGKRGDVRGLRKNICEPFFFCTTQAHYRETETDKPPFGPIWTNPSSSSWDGGMSVCSVWSCRQSQSVVAWLQTGADRFGKGSVKFLPPQQRG